MFVHPRYTGKQGSNRLKRRSRWRLSLLVRASRSIWKRQRISGGGRKLVLRLNRAERRTANAVLRRIFRQTWALLHRLPAVLCVPALCLGLCFHQVGKRTRLTRSRLHADVIRAASFRSFRG